jgi:hypothetical protein
MNIGATINRISNALWATKAKKDGNMQAFPTENFANVCFYFFLSSTELNELEISNCMASWYHRSSMGTS